MYNANNPRHKLRPDQIKHLQRCFEDEGWRINWLSVYFGIYKNAVLFHIRNNGWVRRIKVVNHMPKEVAETYRARKKERYERKLKGTYEFIKMSNDQQKMESCGHVRWVKRCSLCGQILGSDATDHQH